MTTDVERHFAAVRLRRAFHYPDDEDDNSNAPSTVLDEEEQASLIATLSTQNTQRNDQYRVYLTALPVLATLPYLIFLFRAVTGSLPPLPLTTSLTILLALSSLASTWFLLKRLPPTKTGIAALDALTGDHAAGTRGPAASAFVQISRGPLEQWLPCLNLALCTVLLLTGLLLPPGPATAPSQAYRVLALIPALVNLVGLVAKVVMAGVDPERELSGLKYDLKGA